MRIDPSEIFTQLHSYTCSKLPRYSVNKVDIFTSRFMKNLRKLQTYKLIPDNVTMCKLRLI